MDPLKPFFKEAKEMFSKYDSEISFSEPPDKKLGDISTTLCFELAKRYRKSPDELAEEIVDSIDLESFDYISEVRAVNGYINLFFDSRSLMELTMRTVYEYGDRYGKTKERSGYVILEHTSANPNGPLHLGHARNTIIGDTLARLLSSVGYKLERQFYVNDMGRQIAVLVWYCLKEGIPETDEKFDHVIASLYVKANEELEKNPDREKEIINIMRKYEKKDPEIDAIFKKIVDSCLKSQKETLEKIKVFHDNFVWESKFVWNSDVKKILERLKESRYAKFDRSFSLDLHEFGIEKDLILLREDGTTLYPLRDIAYHLWKLEKSDLAIDILGSDHKLPFKQLIQAIKILGFEKTPEAVFYEFISLPEGSMSTRRGIYISLDDLIDETIKRAYAEVKKRRPDLSEEEMKKISEIVGIGAIRYNIIRIAPEKPITFKWEEALDFERQGSPFIQYAHARACKILEKDFIPDLEEVDVSLLKDDHEIHLIKQISKFPRIVLESALEFKPHLLANYAQELATLFNRFYKYLPVLKAETDLKKARLALVYCSKVTLKNSLNILGIESPRSM
ncbi:MAG: arginine--tRNA ligase [Candidatus Hydrothermarchaeota archaeon]